MNVLSTFNLAFSSTCSITWAQCVFGTYYRTFFIQQWYFEKLSWNCFCLRIPQVECHVRAAVVPVHTTSQAHASSLTCATTSYFAYIVLKIMLLQTKYICSTNYLVIYCLPPWTAFALYACKFCEQADPHSISLVRSAYDSIGLDDRRRIPHAHAGRCTNESGLYVYCVSAMIDGSHAVCGLPSTRKVLQSRSRIMVRSRLWWKLMVAKLPSETAGPEPMPHLAVSVHVSQTHPNRPTWKRRIRQHGGVPMTLRCRPGRSRLPENDMNGSYHWCDLFKIRTNSPHAESFPSHQ